MSQWRELQRWAGEIIDFDGSSVWLLLRDITAGDKYPEEEMEIGWPEFITLYGSDQFELNQQVVITIVADGDEEESRSSMGIAPLRWTQAMIDEAERNATEFWALMHRLME